MAIAPPVPLGKLVLTLLMFTSPTALRLTAPPGEVIVPVLVKVLLAVIFTWVAVMAEVLTSLLVTVRLPRET